MPEQTEAEGEPKIVIGKVASVNIYQVTDSELEIIERGSYNSIFLNFFIFFIPIAFSFLVTLLTVKIDSIYIYSIFVIICVVCFLLGAIFFILWNRTRKDSNKIINQIKARIK